MSGSAVPRHGSGSATPTPARRCRGTGAESVGAGSSDSRTAFWKPQIQLTEWETREPEQGTPLWGMDLSDGRVVAEELRRRGQLEVLELVRGLELRASSWVPERVGRPIVGIDLGAGRAWSAAVASARVEREAPGAPQVCIHTKTACDAARVRPLFLRTVSRLRARHVTSIDANTVTISGNRQEIRPCLRNGNATAAELGRRWHRKSQESRGRPPSSG